MKLIRLLYFSEATRDMSLADMKAILEKARTNNHDLDICGMLCYDNNYFLQILEGEAAEVTELFLTISNDERHHSVVIVGVQEIENRVFPQWDMGYAGSSDTLLKLMQEVGCDQFQPQALSFKQAATLLYELSKSQTQV
ncbi:MULTISPECIES: BLUF domain-containing protein [Vibrio]|uniref:Blue light sensor protein n=2 Tax=Vibrio TaxID=662 RepID=A0A7X4RVP9_9VIBR|nr:MULTISPECIES: BLUF domain-containing protein [Vibrio]MBF9003035.1 BLUF domain-containing protein [Vibrio nitrifigilis]MZI94522.1 blue light sensor protein [Vibrio eleionomae]